MAFPFISDSVVRSIFFRVGLNIFERNFACWFLYLFGWVGVFSHKLRRIFIIECFDLIGNIFLKKSYLNRLLKVLWAVAKRLEYLGFAVFDFVHNLSLLPQLIFANQIYMGAYFGLLHLWVIQIFVLQFLLLHQDFRNRWQRSLYFHYSLLIINLFQSRPNCLLPPK